MLTPFHGRGLRRDRDFELLRREPAAVERVNLERG